MRETPAGCGRPQSKLANLTENQCGASFGNGSKDFPLTANFLRKVLAKSRSQSETKRRQLKFFVRVCVFIELSSKVVCLSKSLSLHVFEKISVANEMPDREAICKCAGWRENRYSQNGSLIFQAARLREFSRLREFFRVFKAFRSSLSLTTT